MEKPFVKERSDWENLASININSSTLSSKTGEAIQQSGTDIDWEAQYECKVFKIGNIKMSAQN